MKVRIFVVSIVVLLAGCVPMPPAKVEMADLSLEEKVGQMFMIRTSGNFYHESSYTYQQVIRVVREKGIGGVIHSSSNIHGIVENLNQLQRLSRIPLLVAADYERGVGQQLEGGTLFPANMALAATNSPQLAYEQGRVTAREARAVGVHVTFAPVMDVNSNPENPIINFRSFGDSPGIVTKFGVEFIRGAQEHGLIATAKHFPGHGDTGIDSHTTLPIIDADKEKFRNVDLAPFKAAVDAGVRMIMVGHIAVPSLEENRIPATLSYDLNGRILREEFGFRGIIVTDAMTMGGITESYWAGEAAIRSIEAGSDMVLLPVDMERAIQSVTEAVKSGRIQEERIDESVNRILAAKGELGLWKNREVSLKKARSLVSQPEFRSIARDIAQRSITLVKDEHDLIPVPVESIDTLIHIMLSTDEGLMPRSRSFRTAVSTVHGNVRTSFISEPLTDLEIRERVEKAQLGDFILCSILIRVTANKGTVTIHESHRRLLSELQATGKPVVVVSFGSPYVNDVDGIGTYLCAYGYGSVSQRAMANALFGAEPITGRLPVDLSPNLLRGRGLNRIKRTMLTRSEEAYDFSEAIAVLDSAVSDSVFPGAQIVVSREGNVVWSYQKGRQTYDPMSSKVTENTIYDLSSLTKVVATTPVVMKLVEKKLLPLDEPAYHFFPEFAGEGREQITIRHLLTHSSGLLPFIQFIELGIPRERVLSHILKSPLLFDPGDSTTYSDLGFIVQGAVVEKVAAKSLDVLASDWVYTPLGMRRTFFAPDKTYLPDIAPTEVDSVYRKRLLHGEVDDERAWLLGGIAPHAGLFSTANDLARYAQMLMDDGFLEGKRHFKRSTVANFTARQEIPPGSERALGWDTPSDSLSSAGELFSQGTYGHVGFTGTSIWIDPHRRIAVILLTNRIHPTRGENLEEQKQKKQKMKQVRRDFHNAVMRAMQKPA